MFKVITKIADTPSLTKVSSKENLNVNKEANKKIVFDEYKCNNYGLFKSFSFFLQIVVVWNNVNKAPPSGKYNGFQ